MTDDEKFKQDVYTHMGETRQYNQNMKEYIAAVSANCKTNTSNIMAKLDDHFQDHAQETKEELISEKKGIISERRNNVKTWLEIIAIGLSVVTFVLVYLKK